MNFRLAALGFSFVAARLFAQQDSVAQVRTLIEREASRADVQMASLPALLRPDSGSRRADASFESWKQHFDVLVDSIDRHLQAAMVQVIIDPDGPMAEDARSKRGVQSSRDATPHDRALADSLRAILERHGIHAADAEGDMYYSASGAALLREAGPFVTPPLRQFAGLRALEDRAPSGGDAGVAVSWEELARRLAVSDRLLTDHPTLAFAPELRGSFSSYLSALLGEWDNSSGFSLGKSHVLLADARVRLERYASAHPDTRGGRIVKDYLAVLRANGWIRTRAVEDFLGQAMRRAEAP